uniref:Uncharacterized protein n=1 Tax=Meloidogyne enterolobii TaxID=390850 RepID=A0A6V7VIZ2_MELEN|nr:unnamed protein product [Meloidogyne enterolobii]
MVVKLEDLIKKIEIEKEEKIRKNREECANELLRMPKIQDILDGITEQFNKEIEEEYKQKMEELKKKYEEQVLVLPKNKLVKVDEVMSCCDSKCLPAGSFCCNGNGIVKIRECGIFAKYFCSTQNLEGNRPIMVVAESEFMRANIPSDVSGQTYVVFYCEMIVIPDTYKNMDWKAELGLYKDANCFFRVSSDGHYYTATTKRMFSEPLTGCVIFGVGQIFPPRNKLNAPTQIFFTMDGKQIDKTILMSEDVDLLPHIIVKNCDAEVNFGMDDTKPFTYDIGKHEADYDN